MQALSSGLEMSWGKAVYLFKRLRKMLYRFKAYRFCDFGDGHIRSLYKLKRMEHPNADNILMKRLPDAVEHGAVYIVRMIVELHTDRCI